MSTPGNVRLTATLPGLDFAASANLGTPAALQATLPALVFAAQSSAEAAASLTGRLPPLTLLAQARYASYAMRPLTGQSASRWQPATASCAGVQDRREATAQQHEAGRTRWQRATHLTGGVTSRLVSTRMRLPWRCEAPQQDAARLLSGAGAGHGDTIRLRLASSTLFARALRTDWLRWQAAHQDCWRDRRRSLTAQHQEALRHIGRFHAEGILSADVLRLWWTLLWQAAMRPLPGRHPAMPFVPPRSPACYTPSAHLVFDVGAAQDADLLFVCGHHSQPAAGSVPVPVRKVYVVINEISLARWPDGTPVPVLGLSLSLDADSWTWGFEATLPLSAEALVMSDVGSAPVELIATVNGTAFHVLAENLSRDRVFGDASIRISGRGRSAALAAPYAPVLNFANTEPRSAQQLMEDVLSINGIPLGWTVDWALTDWLVPAGVFARQGTWIEALTDIAQAAGAYVLPHPSEKVLRVRHRYPVVPWRWWNEVTPDFVLPVDTVARESLRWVDKPAYNRVFVAGQETGVLGQVTRSGTAGDVLAPMVVDALITQAAAARQRGSAAWPSCPTRDGRLK